MFVLDNIIHGQTNLQAGHIQCKLFTKDQAHVWAHSFWRWPHATFNNHQLLPEYRFEDFHVVTWLSILYYRYGMIGACFEDYDKIGGWDTR